VIDIYDFAPYRTIVDVAVVMAACSTNPVSG
jgi:hypothetical protein